MATVCDGCRAECDWACDECGGDYCDTCLSECACGGSYCLDCRKEHFNATDNNGLRLYELCELINEPAGEAKKQEPSA